MAMTKEEILKRIGIEQTRIASIDKNMTGLVGQRERSQEEEARLQALYESMLAEEDAAATEEVAEGQPEV
ncbi:MAG TPA: hypothetical protein VN441_02910 [Syntrophomonas sp.]|nr:hypothetical protein [Syntrophomonas sp.]